MARTQLLHLQIGQLDSVDHGEAVAVMRFFGLKHSADPKSVSMVVEASRKICRLLAARGIVAEPIRVFFARPAKAVNGRSVACYHPDTGYADTAEGAVSLSRKLLGSLGEAVIFEVTPDGESPVGATDFAGRYQSGADAPRRLNISV